MSPLQRQLTPAARPWIDQPQSMTRAIAERFHSTPQVQPVFEGPGRLAPWENRWMIAGNRRGYVREVVLEARGVPVLVARTVSLLGDSVVDVLRRLGHRPLAELLFEDVSWSRINTPVPLLDRQSGNAGRTGLWQYGNSSRILVTEFFLPALLCTELSTDLRSSLYRRRNELIRR